MHPIDTTRPSGWADKPYPCVEYAINFNYEISPGDGKTVFNVSFTMMPEAGLRYKASENLYPFIETSLVVLADGPPIGFPKSSKATGYNAITAGVTYRFK